MMRDLAALASGLLFGLGLAVAQMTDPWKVQAFLDIAGNWDPSLALVLGGAVTISLIGFRLVTRGAKPLFEDRFHLPKSNTIDMSLVMGSALFGVGWGLVGYCPGPALAAIARPTLDGALFVAAMVAGMWLHRALVRS